jgi:hypothetical protein
LSRPYLTKYHSEIPEGWVDISDWINRVFNIQTDSDYKALGRELQVEEFDISKIKESYIKLKNKYINIEDDILKFISFLFGTSYFSKIGNPTFDRWLNAVDLNHPNKKKEELGYGFSFQDVLQYKFGQNAIRKNLLSTFRWISSQSST